MDARLLEKYNQELRFIREMGTEFAKQYPKIAGRLDLGSTECGDPYVERLLEGFAFLTARIQLKMDAEFPRFTQHLLEMVYPHYLAPLPSMTVVQFDPDLKGGVTEQGFLLPRHTELRSTQSVKGHVSCKFRTAQDVMLWPIRLTQAEYLSRGDAAHYAAGRVKGVKAAFRLRLETVMDMAFKDIAIDKLHFFLKGTGDIATQIYELLLAHSLGVVVQPAIKKPGWSNLHHRRCIQPMGFDDDQALLPYGHRSFQGYRLLQEYFALPERFLFVEINDLAGSVQRCDHTALEIVILLDKAQDTLEDLFDAENIALNCSPAVNLFPKRADRIHLNHRSTDHHLVIDRTRPLDYEVYTVAEVAGYGSGSIDEQIFHPFYAVQDGMAETERAYYTIERRPTLESISSIGTKTKSRYLGSEVFVSLVDADETPYQSELKQLGVDVLCTNRGLAQYMLSGQEVPELNLEIGAPVNAVRSLTGFTDPKAAYPDGEYSWRLISHLSLNYLTLLDDDENDGAKALQELLGLYGDFAQTTIKKQIEGVLAVTSQQVVRRIPVDGPMAFGRGMEITITLDDLAFQGTGAFLLGAVLERFFSKYVSINSFTQTRVKTRERGEIMQWPVRTGTRTLI